MKIAKQKVAFFFPQGVLLPLSNTMPGALAVTQWLPDHVASMTAIVVNISDCIPISTKTTVEKNNFPETLIFQKIQN